MSAWSDHRIRFKNWKDEEGFKKVMRDKFTEAFPDEFLMIYLMDGKCIVHNGKLAVNKRSRWLNKMTFRLTEDGYEVKNVTARTDPNYLNLAHQNRIAAALTKSLEFAKDDYHSRIQ